MPAHPRPGVGAGVSASVMVALVVLAAGEARAAAGEHQGMRGVWLGRWFVRPSVSFSAGYDTNVFRRSESDPLRRPLADRVVETGAQVEILRSGVRHDLRLGYEADDLRYDRVQLNQNLAQRFTAGWESRLGRHLRLRLEDTYRRGVTGIESVDEGGELVFDGRAFRLNLWQVTLARAGSAIRGFTVRAYGSALNYDDREGVRFFEFRGAGAGVEYREPLGPATSLLLFGEARDYDHFTVADPAGQSFRREDGRWYGAGIAYRSPAGSWIDLRAGWNVSRFPGGRTPGFRGVAAVATAQVPLGSRTGAEVQVVRRPSPSFFLDQTHFVIRRIQVSLVHDWRASTLEIRTSTGANRYGSPEPALEGLRRRDRLQRLGASLSLQGSWPFRVILESAYEVRRSNFDPADYRVWSSRVGLGFGWP